MTEVIPEESQAEIEAYETLDTSVPNFHSELGQAEAEEEDVAMDKMHSLSMILKRKKAVTFNEVFAEARKNREKAASATNASLNKPHGSGQRPPMPTPEAVGSSHGSHQRQGHQRHVRWSRSTESLDEAFSGYSAVEVSKDLTDEILSEIYGSTSGKKEIFG